jgi:hypothetical protein
MQAIGFGGTSKAKKAQLDAANTTARAAKRDPEASRY